MKSSLIIRAEPLTRNKGVMAMMNCMVGLSELSERLSCSVALTMQHNIRDDHFAIMVETKARTFGHHGKTFEEVFRKLNKELRNEKLRAAKEQAAREEGGSGHRRPSPERKRFKPLRQGRLQKRRRSPG